MMARVLTMALALAAGTPCWAAGKEPPKAAAQKAGSARQALEAGVDSLREALKAHATAETLAGLFANVFDFEELARLSLGDAWAAQSKDDQARFAGLLRAVIEANYLPRLATAPSDFGLNVVSEQEEAGTATLRVQASGKTAKLPLDFKLRQAKGKWLLFDTVVDGVGLVDTYQEQFSRMIAKSGMPGVLKALEAKKAALDAQKAKPAP